MSPGGPVRTAPYLSTGLEDHRTNTYLGRAQRNSVWLDVEPAFFQPGMRILDIGCGTGEDAAHFA